jgi:hypothetical protein
MSSDVRPPAAVVVGIDQPPPGRRSLARAAREAVPVVGGVGCGRIGGALGRSVSAAAVTRRPGPVIVVPATAGVASAGKGGPR